MADILVHPVILPKEREVNNIDLNTETRIPDSPEVAEVITLELQLKPDPVPDPEMGPEVEEDQSNSSCEVVTTAADDVCAQMQELKLEQVDSNVFDEANPKVEDASAEETEGMSKIWLSLECAGKTTLVHSKYILRNNENFLMDTLQLKL